MLARGNHHREFTSLLQSDPRKEYEYRFLDGKPGRSSLADMILHACTHGFHHRGQMAALASAAGEKFPDTSHIGFSRVP